VETLRKLNGPLERGIHEFQWTSGASREALYVA
jgi:hypothetical protein